MTANPADLLAQASNHVQHSITARDWRGPKSQFPRVQRHPPPLASMENRAEPWRAAHREILLMQVSACSCLIETAPTFTYHIPLPITQDYSSELTAIPIRPFRCPFHQPRTASDTLRPATRGASLQHYPASQPGAGVSLLPSQPSRCSMRSLQDAACRFPHRGLLVVPRRVATEQEVGLRSPAPFLRARGGAIKRWEDQETMRREDGETSDRTE